MSVWLILKSVGLILRTLPEASAMMVSIPLDLSTRTFTPLPRFIRPYRPPPLLTPSLTLFPPSSDLVTHPVCSSLSFRGFSVPFSDHHSGGSFCCFSGSLYRLFERLLLPRPFVYWNYMDYCITDMNNTRPSTILYIFIPLNPNVPVTLVVAGHRRTRRSGCLPLTIS